MFDLLYNVKGDHVIKKILICISILALLLVGCGKKGSYVGISYSELETKLNNKESFVFVIGSDTCSACTHYEPTMKKVTKDEGIDIFFINLNSLSEEENAKIYSKFVVSSTPTTIFIKDGNETSTYDRIIGAADYAEVIKSLEKLGYVGE